MKDQDIKLEMDLSKAWGLLKENMETTGLGLPMEAEVVPSTDTGPYLEKLKSLLTITDSEVEVEIKLGWVTIGRIEEEDGLWYPSINNKTMATLGKTKEQAIEFIIRYYMED
jgi:hypothetical protein